MIELIKLICVMIAPLSILGIVLILIIRRAKEVEGMDDTNWLGAMELVWKLPTDPTLFYMKEGGLFKLPEYFKNDVGENIKAVEENARRKGDK